ncbi:MAG: hypothetical protein WA947_22430 [Phormidesmis sp.]
MRVREDQIRLDCDKSYPCPVCRRGRLNAITLTEAWGCDDCQEIFEQETANTIRKLTTPYPHQAIWQWTGKGWERLRPKMKPDRLRRAIGAIALIALIWLALTALELVNIPLKIGVAALILIVLTVMWIGLRR